MTEALKKRRRWPWVLVALVLMTAASFAWRSRPLNEMERALVGEWRSADPDRKLHVAIQLAANRRYRTTVSGNETGTGTGRWTARGNTICFGQDVSFWGETGMPWRIRFQNCFNTLLTVETVDFRVDGPDRVWLEGHEFVRVHDEAAGR